jgi:hypothetical protein
MFQEMKLRAKQHSSRRTVSTALLTDQVTACHKRHVPAVVAVLICICKIVELIGYFASSRYKHRVTWVLCRELDRALAVCDSRALLQDASTPALLLFRFFIPRIGVTDEHTVSWSTEQPWFCRAVFSEAKQYA